MDPGQVTGERSVASGQVTREKSVASCQVTGERLVAPGQVTGERSVAPGQVTGERSVAPGQVAGEIPDFSLTRAGPVLGATRAGPGGLNTPPPLTRLLVHLAISGRQRSKARQKSFRKYFSHFLGQVKGKVTRGHRR